MAAGVFVSASLCPCVNAYTSMHSCEAIYMCVHVFVLCTAGRGVARSGRLMFVLEDSMTSFIPVRISGIICNLTTVGFWKTSNRPYGYVWFTAGIMLPVYFSIKSTFILISFSALSKDKAVPPLRAGKNTKLLVKYGLTR